MPTEPRAVAIIPARWASTRFPGKPLALIKKKPMIQWVVEQAQKASRVSEIIVATDDDRIFDAVIGFGGKAVMTSQDHATGSDRIAEVQYSRG
jgi:3-deoxy-manno-octulosonate cytidylyltransferase (CMP-KDO synthetase)